MGGRQAGWKGDISRNDRPGVVGTCTPTLEQSHNQKRDYFY